MRIAIDIRVADPIESGQQRYLWRLGRWLAGRGHDTHFLTVRPQGDAVSLPDGCTLHRLARQSRHALRDTVTALAPDVLLLNPERSRRWAGVKANVLRAAYGTDQYRQKLRSFRSGPSRAARAALRLTPWTLADRVRERRFYEGEGQPPWVIAQSGYMRDQILDTYDLPESRVRVVPNGVDTSEFSVRRRLELRDQQRARWSIPEDALCLLLLGHNLRLKGLPALLESARRLRAGGAPVHVLVAGRGTGSAQRKAADRLVGRAGLAGHVTFAGGVVPSMDALAAADALIHLSWHDSFGFSVLEAMACGLPVVGTPWVGACELMHDGVSGLIVDPADAPAVDRVIGRLTDPEVRSALGDSAAEVARRHDEATSFAGVLDVFQAASGASGS